MKSFAGLKALILFTFSCFIPCSLLAAPATCQSLLNNKASHIIFKTENLDRTVIADQIVKSTVESTIERIYKIHESSQFAGTSLPRDIVVFEDTRAMVQISYSPSPHSPVISYSHIASGKALAGKSSRLVEEVSHEMGHIIAAYTSSHLNIRRRHWFHMIIEEMFSDFMEELLSFEIEGELRSYNSEGSNLTDRTFTHLHTKPILASDYTISKMMGFLEAPSTLNLHVHTNDIRLGVGQFIQESHYRGKSSAEIYSSVLDAVMKFLVWFYSEESKGDYPLGHNLVSNRIPEYNMKFLEFLNNSERTNIQE